jgi:hypothetical protein
MIAGACPRSPDTTFLQLDDLDQAKLARVADDAAELHCGGQLHHLGSIA